MDVFLGLTRFRMHEIDAARDSDPMMRDKLTGKVLMKTKDPTHREATA